jgi:hypothetical protein
MGASSAFLQAIHGRRGLTDHKKVIAVMQSRRASLG